MKTKWRTLTGKPIDDIVKWVDEAAASGRDVHVGTDSLQAGKSTFFVTVCVVLNPPKGGRVAYTRTVVPRISSLRERLSKEVWMSVELGLQFSALPTVHIDANPNERHMSSKYLQELVGMVVGQGFECRYKPDSWAATHAADHCVRYKNSQRTPTERRHALRRKSA